MLTTINGTMLAEAFPVMHLPVAKTAGEAVARLLAPTQWTQNFVVLSEGQGVLIPYRLHFQSDRLSLEEKDEAWRYARALQTRSNDGFERQLAVRDLLADLQPWAAPFIIALIGEYVVEILDDIAEALTPAHAQLLSDFIVQNRPYWSTTKSRVASYWNVYYRANWSSELRRPYRRDEYVGFKLIDQIEKVASGKP